MNVVGNLLVVVGLAWGGWSLLSAERFRAERARLAEIIDRHRDLRATLTGTVLTLVAAVLAF